MPRLLILVNKPDFFISHRLPIAIEAKKQGYEVHIASSEAECVSTIIRQGLIHHAIPLSRSGTNLFSEIKTFFSVLLLLWKLKPDILHLVTIKPVLYGGIAARLAPVKFVVSAISGLGFIFISKGRKANLIRFFVAILYRFALGKKNSKIIFQNLDDKQALKDLTGLPLNNSTLIKGSGVDLTQYTYHPEHLLEHQEIVITFAARLLWDKGVGEFIGAAETVLQKGYSVRFQLVGDIDPGNPASVAQSDIEEWKRKNIVQLLGHRNDINAVFADSNIVVLPSYREGFPKVLIEAAACGRAVITSDVPGCRDAIKPEITGILVKTHDIPSLVAAIEQLIINTDIRYSMGKAGRELAEREYSINKIVLQHIDIYRSANNSQD